MQTRKDLSNKETIVHKAMTDKVTNKELLPARKEQTWYFTLWLKQTNEQTTFNKKINLTSKLGNLSYIIYCMLNLDTRLSIIIPSAFRSCTMLL
jgi:hypothetical protein